jgi:hypothetical protein
MGAGMKPTGMKPLLRAALLSLVWFGVVSAQVTGVFEPGGDLSGKWNNQTIVSGAVTLSKMANEDASTILCNNTGSPTAPIACTPAQVQTLLATTGSAPTVSSCGVSPSIKANATSASGTVTAGSGALTSCTVTFASAGYATWNNCRVSSQQSTAGFAYSYTKTAITVTATSLTSDVFDYNCDGV